MLYFVFNEKSVCVFVAHDPAKDEWVCQIPVFPPYQNLSDYTSSQIVQMVADGLLTGYASGDNQAATNTNMRTSQQQKMASDAQKWTDRIRVLSTNMWTMNAQVAEKFCIPLHSSNDKLTQHDSISGDHHDNKIPRIFLVW